MEDLDLNAASFGIGFHPLPGPHVLSYFWWFFANQFQRWWDRRFKGLKFDLTYSPGINCLDADVISVHIVFAEFRLQVRDALKFCVNPLSSWPYLLHRRIYYRLVIALERVVYGGKKAVLNAVSAKSARDLHRYGWAKSQVPILLHGTDRKKFDPDRRKKLRASARQALGLADGVLCLLLVGNDWKKKGLNTVLEALGVLKTVLRALVGGGRRQGGQLRHNHGPTPSQKIVWRPPPPAAGYKNFTTTPPPSIYVGPSLEDAFNLPPMEAMANVEFLPLSAASQGSARFLAMARTGSFCGIPT